MPVENQTRKWGWLVCFALLMGSDAASAGDADYLLRRKPVVYFQQCFSEIGDADLVQLRIQFRISNQEMRSKQGSEGDVHRAG